VTTGVNACNNLLISKVVKVNAHAQGVL